MSERLNLMSPAMLADPYPTYAELRRDAPVCQVDPGGFWAVTRHDDVVAVLKDTALFSSEGFRAATKPAWLGHNPFGDSMLVLDPPAHGRLRSLVNRAFTPAAMARLEARVRAFAEDIAARLPLGEPIDWVESLAMPLPASVIGELLGLDPSLHPRFKRWTDDLTSVAPVTPDMTARMEEIRTTVREAEQYLTEVLARRRREPADDMVTDLLGAQVDGQSLTDAELMSFLFLLLVGGLETTVHLLSHSALQLIAHPEVLDRLRAEPALIPRFVDEVLRYEPPVRSVYRIATADTELGGVRLTKGAKVLVMIGSASRDEAHFPDAHRFDIDRVGVTHLPFGHGIHFCLGAPLARLEARLMLTALLPRVRRLSPAGPPAWRKALSVRGVTSLPLVAHPA
ncbi:cytochrome P450 [Sorangium sp. So ce260]|uniref:cytochrome P450 n=1 Tax=Sorangium sp. So ce260 TaxID=3133291 RepID=UPI003F5E7705